MARPVTHSLMKTLRGVPDFATLDDPTLLDIVGSSMCLFWSAGSPVFRQGDQAEALYVVASGRVRICDPADGEDDEVAVIEPGDYFGEHALLFHTAHTKTAEAVEDTECIVIPRESFEPILTVHPRFAAEFRQKLEARLFARYRP